MGNAVIYLWAVIVCFALCVTIHLAVYLRIKKILRHASLEKFKDTLGSTYHYRKQISGWAKYKWKILLMIVKASFNDSGELMEWEIKLCSFLPFKKTFA